MSNMYRVCAFLMLGLLISGFCTHTLRLYVTCGLTCSLAQRALGKATWLTAVKTPAPQTRICDPKTPSSKSEAHTPKISKPQLQTEDLLLLVSPNRPSIAEPLPESRTKFGSPVRAPRPPTAGQPPLAPEGRCGGLSFECKVITLFGMAMLTSST